jgi:hypothetical protein
MANTSSVIDRLLSETGDDAIMNSTIDYLNILRRAAISKGRVSLTPVNEISLWK